MRGYSFVDNLPRPYLYVDRRCAMVPSKISEAMGVAFHDVMGFMEANDIPPAGPALSVYYTYDPDTVEFRAGFFVSEENAEKAAGLIKAGTTPAGRVLTLTHVGPYSAMQKTYGEMMGWLEQEHMTIGAPTWEVYVDDPDSTPEKDLRTQIFVTVN